MRRKAIAAGVLAVAAITATGCQVGGNKANQWHMDGPRSSVVNRDPADIVEMPDGFTNLATKCDNGNRVYVAFHSDGSYASVAVVPNATGC